MNLKLNYLILIILIPPIFLFSCKQNKQIKKENNVNNRIQTLTTDGAWCWFSDPRAIYYSENEIITGWVKKDGSIETGSLNIQTGEKEFEIINPKMEIDDHDNPAFAVIPDRNIITMYAWHSTNKGIISNTTVSGFDVHSFEENVVFKPKTDTLLKQFQRETYTYANPYFLKSENKLFSFGRWIGYKPNVIISSDNGKTWDEQYVIVSNEPFDPNNRPYAKYYSDGYSKIHMIYTNGHPRNEEFNSVYYCYYENGSFWKIDGTKICNLEDLPFSIEDGSLVYQATAETGRAWIADIVEKNGTPYILYSRHPEETDHRYHYAWYNSDENRWKDVEICKAGKWFPQTPKGEVEQEPHYLGNMTLNPLNSNVVYLSREINGIFEIEKYETKNDGKNWEITPVTQNSEYDNVRPYVPRYLPDNSKTVVLWMENKKYIHYTDFDTSIKYIIEN